MHKLIKTVAVISKLGKILTLNHLRFILFTLYIKVNINAIKNVHLLFSI